MLKASRKSRRVLLAGATGIMALTVAGLGLTASGAAAEQIRATAATQVPLLVAQAAPVPPPAPPTAAADAPATPAAPAAPFDPRRVKKVVIVKDGKTETYEGAEANAFLAKHPEFAASGGKRLVRLHKLAIRDKDGKLTTLEGDAVEAYLRDHPEARPPLPPLPPMGIGAVPPPPGGWGKGQTRVFVNRADLKAPRGFTGPSSFVVNVPEMVDGKCPDDGSTSFFRNEEKDGKKVMVICRTRIDRFADAQAKWGLANALTGLETGRAAIVGNRNLTEEQRRQALAGIESARVEIERELREERAKK